MVGHFGLRTLPAMHAHPRVPFARQLIYSGKQLADDKTLESYGVAAGGTIHMVLQLRLMSFSLSSTHPPLYTFTSMIFVWG